MVVPIVSPLPMSSVHFHPANDGLQKMVVIAVCRLVGKSANLLVGYARCPKSLAHPGENCIRVAVTSDQPDSHFRILGFHRLLLSFRQGVDVRATCRRRQVEDSPDGWAQ